MRGETDIRFIADTIGHRIKEPVHYRHAPKGFFERRLLGRATADDHDFANRELAFQLTSRDFQEYLQSVDKTINRVKAEVLDYYWSTVKVDIITL